MVLKSDYANWDSNNNEIAEGPKSVIYDPYLPAMLWIFAIFGIILLVLFKWCFTCVCCAQRSNAGHVYRRTDCDPTSSMCHF